MKFDVVIVGGGLVGASLAAGLAGSGLSIALVDAREPAPAVAGADWDSRIYAISPGSVAWLSAGGAWDRVPPERIAPVYDMEIHGDAGDSHLAFSAYEAGLAELCCIAESGALQAALRAAVQAAPDIEVFCPARCSALRVAADAAVLELDGGRRIEAGLVVGADGGDSWVRQQAGIDARPTAYGQTAVVANFAAAYPHRNVARQWFRGDGVLAFLPLPGNRVSIVWSTGEAHAQALLALDEAALADAVGDASGDALGKLELITRAAGFPLRIQRVASLVRPRIALVGDAAHNVHPLAGQGVNLGFRDARELGAVLRERGPQPDCGALSLLRRYERRRREDVATLQLTTDMLVKLFRHPAPSVRWLRNSGLAFVGQLPMLRRRLIAHAVA
jgi:ubiquinone biosynthesis UbiH/UbiF/VisC/COQ6 family hydroxylase